MYSIMKKYLPTVLLIVGLTAGFAGGYLFKNYQLTKLRGNLRNGMGNVNGQRFVPNGGQANGQNKGMFGGGIEGEVVSIDDKSITVKLSDGSSKIILLQDSTVFSESNIIKKEILVKGSKLNVFGKQNSDGSLTADRIQLTTSK